MHFLDQPPSRVELSAQSVLLQYRSGREAGLATAQRVRLQAAVVPSVQKATAAELAVAG